MNVTLIQATPNPVETIAQIASICYDSDPKDPMKLVKHLYAGGHHSVFEHIYFTFKIEGISRACSHQLVRHRHCSFTQRSQRYCSEDGFEYVMPPSLKQSAFSCDMEDIQDWYIGYRDFGVPNEDARYILPNACATSLYLSCNLFIINEYSAQHKQAASASASPNGDNFRIKLPLNTTSAIPTSATSEPYTPRRLSFSEG